MIERSWVKFLIPPNIFESRHLILMVMSIFFLLFEPMSLGLNFKCL